MLVPEGEVPGCALVEVGVLPAWVGVALVVTVGVALPVFDAINLLAATTDPIQASITTTAIIASINPSRDFLWGG
ncbi:hypothetical protein KDW_50320 [Dictyobacter vulcani]|uniref:Uncharacterized protein n=1 Tax=Dictyobacter vulcani TaxID=2607529 RepID=A0A5J4KWG3_9CHLR|nr:hypothetical protein KDW_50320 [Dictyobacter vulcani]